MLTEAQWRVAQVFGAGETHFLVNGSTAGILSAISGCTKYGGTLLMARNCHRSAYHGAELRGLKTVYLYPQYIPELGINRRDFAGRCGKCIAKAHHREKKAGGWEN